MTYRNQTWAGAAALLAASSLAADSDVIARSVPI